MLSTIPRCHELSSTSRRPPRKMFNNQSALTWRPNGTVTSVGKVAKTRPLTSGAGTPLSSKGSTPSILRVRAASAYTSSRFSSRGRILLCSRKQAIACLEGWNWATKIRHSRFSPPEWAVASKLPSDSSLTRSFHTRPATLRRSSPDAARIARSEGSSLGDRRAKSDSRSTPASVRRRISKRVVNSASGAATVSSQIGTTEPSRSGCTSPYSSPLTSATS